MRRSIVILPPVQPSVCRIWTKSVSLHAKLPPRLRAVNWNTHTCKWPFSENHNRSLQWSFSLQVSVSLCHWLNQWIGSWTTSTRTRITTSNSYRRCGVEVGPSLQRWYKTFLDSVNVFWTNRRTATKWGAVHEARPFSKCSLCRYRHTAFSTTQYKARRVIHDHVISALPQQSWKSSVLVLTQYRKY